MLPHKRAKFKVERHAHFLRAKTQNNSTKSQTITKTAYNFWSQSRCPKLTIIHVHVWNIRSSFIINTITHVYPFYVSTFLFTLASSIRHLFVYGIKLRASFVLQALTMLPSPSSHLIDLNWYTTLWQMRGASTYQPHKTELQTVDKTNTCVDIHTTTTSARDHSICDARSVAFSESRALMCASHCIKIS